MNIYKELLKLNGYISNHCSDLYVEVNPETTKIINDYEFKCNVTTFRNEVTNKLNYEIPFAYDYKNLGDLK